MDALMGWRQRASKQQSERHPEVTLTLLPPYHPYDRPTLTPPSFDGMFYPPGMEIVPKRVAIVRPNRYMVEHSDYMIAHVTNADKAKLQIGNGSGKFFSKYPPRELADRDYTHYYTK